MWLKNTRVWRICCEILGVGFQPDGRPVDPDSYKAQQLAESRLHDSFPNVLYLLAIRAVIHHDYHSANFNARLESML